MDDTSSTRCYIYVLIKKEDQEPEVHANFDQFDRGRRFHRCRPNHSLSIQILCTLEPIRYSSIAAQRRARRQGSSGQRPRILCHGVQFNSITALLGPNGEEAFERRYIYIYTLDYQNTKCFCLKSYDRIIA